MTRIFDLGSVDMSERAIAGLVEFKDAFSFSAVGDVASVGAFIGTIHDLFEQPAETGQQLVISSSRASVLAELSRLALERFQDMARFAASLGAADAPGTHEAATGADSGGTLVGNVIRYDRG